MKKIFKATLLLLFFLSFSLCFSNNFGWGRTYTNFIIYDANKNISIRAKTTIGHTGGKLFQNLRFEIYKYTIVKDPNYNNVEYLEKIEVINNQSKDFDGVWLDVVNGVLYNDLIYFSTQKNGIYTFNLSTKKIKSYFNTPNSIIDFEIYNDTLVIASKKGVETYNLNTKKFVKNISSNSKIKKISIDEDSDFLLISYADKEELLEVSNSNKITEVLNTEYSAILPNNLLAYTDAETNTLSILNTKTQKKIISDKLTSISADIKVSTKTIKSFQNSYVAIEQEIFKLNPDDKEWKSEKSIITIVNLSNGKIIESNRDKDLLYCNKTYYITLGEINLIKSYQIYYSIPTAHVISIGNNLNSQIDGSGSCINCEKDAIDFVGKVTADYKNITYNEFLDSLSLLKIENLTKRKYRDILKDKKVRGLKTYLLTGKKATLPNIRKTFKKIIQEAKPNDYFIFNYAGMSQEVHVKNRVETSLITYIDESAKVTSFQEKIDLAINKWFTIKELASLMNQIPCTKQIVISEAGNGTSFSNNLIYYLFESNPILAKNNNRNRLILTTKDQGYDYYIDINSGPLNYLINKKGNLLDVFENPELYNYKLLNTSIEDNREWFINYYKLHQERDYTNFLISKYNNTSSSRGATTTSTKKEEVKEIETSKSYALLVATDTFDATKNWSNLKNPFNDVDAVAKILENKYNTEVVVLHNASKTTILKTINNLKAKMSIKDQFLFFIASHGYYSEVMSDGLIVCKESRGLEEDYDKSSYLKMADLHRLLTTLPANNVFAVFDVCFGASFDLFAADIPINNYSRLEPDIKLDDFIKRKNKKKSRIFMASGRYEVPDYWNNSLNHSPFALKLIKAFSEQKEFISPGKIFDFMHGNATEPLLKKFKNHTPQGDFLLKVK